MADFLFVFNAKNEILLKKHEEGYKIPFDDYPIEAKTKELIALPDFRGKKAYAFFSDVEVNEGYEFVPLRASYNVLSFEEYYAAGKASELITFHNNTKFCSICGKKMYKKTDISRQCEGCGREIWAPVQPAIIVLISKGDEVLLVKAKNFSRPYYGLVAGFVETGESLEECVKREVMEETGLSIKNIRYFKSQPWPYPNNIMIGFFADYAGGEIKMQEEELNDCRWFHRDNLPEIPQKLSMARMLIDEWAGRGEKRQKA